MSDYWVSKNKYYCTYCNIYIADDKPVSPILPTFSALTWPDIPDLTISTWYPFLRSPA